MCFKKREFTEKLYWELKYVAQIQSSYKFPLPDVSSRVRNKFGGNGTVKNVLKQRSGGPR